MQMPDPPETHKEFIRRFPKLGEAWALLGEAGAEGPLPDKTVRLLKLAFACGAMSEGAVHSSVRKALAMGISPEEIEQVVAISAATLGLPGTVAVYSWVRDVLDVLEEPGG
ncbi:carboxymuconolactone decarboxylase family protein [Sorangium sp. So ce291]|uniref:carboxymuconolactone decarboxylase family protein n=1 Tax=unclassified Sorangium TaxID=2621164 RepID=UPI003EFEB909